MSDYDDDDDGDGYTLAEDVRRALGLALQIFEELPENRRPESNMRDIRGLLAGQSSGRDGLIITEALAMTLAFQTQRMIANPPEIWADNDSDRELRLKVYNARWGEFASLFGLIGQLNARAFAMHYQQACISLGRLETPPL